MRPINISSKTVRSVKVRVGNKILGHVKPLGSEVYEAFVGSGVSCRYVGQYCSKSAAVHAVVLVVYDTVSDYENT